MSEIKVNSIKGVGASAAAITVNNTDGTCTANITNNLSNRNLIINGAMQVAQRGTSFADPANGTFILDRFSMRNSSGTPAFTFSQDSDAPHGFYNSLKVACTTADTSPASGSISRITYKTEAHDLQPLAKGTSSAKASTLSFYVKTNKTGVYTVFVYDDDNNRMFSASYTVSDTNWNRYTINIPADTTGVMNDDNATGFVINFGLSLGSDRTSGSLASTWATYSTANEHVGNVNFADSTSNVWAITGVQFEVGSVATDFEHRSFGQELALCKRYYQQYPENPGDNYAPIANGRCRSSTQGQAVLLFPSMRSAPSFNYSGAFNFRILHGGSATAVSSFDSPHQSGTAVFLRPYVSSGMTLGHAMMLTVDNSATTRITLSAEL